MINNFFKKYNKQKGYAILFSIILISAISVIIAGLSSTTYKQLILSSLAKNSQIAFYQSDTASDCSFYADLVVNAEDPSFFNNEGGIWSCGGLDLIIKPMNDGNGSYNLEPSNDFQSTNNPCFSISIEKTPSVTEIGFMDTKIRAKGYNICDKNNPRVVEREIEVDY